jgi:hypothetical protein
MLGGGAMPNGKKGENGDYFEENLSKLYEIEDQRQKLDELAESIIKKGGSLSEPALIQQSNTVQQLMNQQTLGKMKQEAEQRERNKNKKEDSDKKN